jgi:ribosomal protein L12E/L44/L45/RPP1/RPP2
VGVWLSARMGNPSGYLRLVKIKATLDEAPLQGSSARKNESDEEEEDEEEDGEEDDEDEVSCL